MLVTFNVRFIPMVKYSTLFSRQIKMLEKCTFLGTFAVVIVAKEGKFKRSCKLAAVRPNST